jgi:UDP-4-amino-4,6-dideoxy-N-acetyl-beta-L-altrosamine transaminase
MSAPGPDVAFIPYSCQSVTPEDVQAVLDVLHSAYLTQGPVVPAFEAAFAARHRVHHAVAVSSATAGLHIGCLGLGIGKGSRVWTSPNSFLASANCALYCGAEIDFVDIDPHTRNMSVDVLAEKLHEASRTGTLPDLLIPVDFSGLPCDLREMRVLADRFGFKILQDASHATGATYLGEPAGSRYADATVFSFHAVKIVTTAEGGLVTTNDASIAARLRLFRSHGMTRAAAEMEGESPGDWYYEQQCLGYNYRLTDLQAALGLSQLKRLEAMHAQRKDRARRYGALLGELPLILPARLDDRDSSLHLYVVEVDEKRTAARRGDVFRRLRAAEIGVNVHYIPIHTQPFYRRLGFRADVAPRSVAYYERALSIPLYPGLSDADQDRVVAELSAALTGQSR